MNVKKIYGQYILQAKDGNPRRLSCTAPDLNDPAVYGDFEGVRSHPTHPLEQSLPITRRLNKIHTRRQMAKINGE